MDKNNDHQDAYETGLEKLSNEEIQALKNEILEKDDPNRPITREELKSMMEWLKRAKNK